MKRLESKEWRNKTKELLTMYQVLMQKQLYDLLIKSGHEVSYQKFNDYLKKDKDFIRKRLFDSSNALMVMLKGTDNKRLRNLEIIMTNGYLIENNLSPLLVFDKDYVRGLKLLTQKYSKHPKINDAQRRDMLLAMNEYEAFVETRNNVLNGKATSSRKDATCFNSLYARGVRFRNAKNNNLYFVVADKHSNLNISKLVKIVADIQEQYETRMNIQLNVVLDVICINEQKKKNLKKKVQAEFEEAYKKEITKRRLLIFGKASVNVKESNLDKYVSNIERYVIA